MVIMVAKNGCLTIGEVAQRVGVATSTLRFYERERLVQPAGRSAAGYRLYDAACVERLQFIRAGQAIGFSLDDMRALLALDERTSCKQVQTLIERRLADVDAKLSDLRRVRATLSGALERCRRSKRGCAVVAELKRPASRQR